MLDKTLSFSFSSGKNEHNPINSGARRWWNWNRWWSFAEFGNSHIFMALADEQQWTHKIINRKSPVCVEIEADVTPDKNSVDDTESDKSTQPGLHIFLFFCYIHVW